MDAQGNFVVAWEATGTSGTVDIFARRFDAAGSPLGDSFLVNTYTTNTQRSLSVAADGDGDFVIAWTSVGQEGPGLGSGVYARRYSAAGVPQGAEFRVNTYTTSHQDNPCTAMDADGDFVIAWTSQFQDGPLSYDLYAQRYNRHGAIQGGEFRVNTHTQGYQGALSSVEMDADGDFVIAWTSYEQDGSDTGVYAQRYDANGAMQGAEFRVSTYTSGKQENPTVGMDGDGDFVVAWESNGQDGSSWGIFAQRFNATGVPLGDEFRVNSYTTNHQIGPSVAVGAAGDFLITWSTTQHEDSLLDVWAQRYNADGVAQGVEFRLNTYTTGSQANPAVAMNEDGDFVVTWSSNRPGVTQSLQAQRYAVTPAVTASAFHFATAPQQLQFSFDRDVSASLGSDDLLVQNLTTGLTVLSSQFTLLYDGASDQATFSYTGGILPDGNYRATLLAAGISTPQGATPAADYSFDFFVLAGDANRDRIVDITDLGILATNWQQSPRTFSQGDFNYDGLVDITDLGILATNWQKSLPRPFGRNT
jgi:hypothetical protein